MTTNKDLIIYELKDQIENLAYENKRMGDFLQALGLAPDEITSYVINGGEPEFETMIDYVSQDIIKNHLFPSHCADKRANE